ncbi:MAG: hypothetical protein JWO92_91 [Chitinophagaceae bacterium]|nr:hypothetical protein [Chitinophagaceae bacterium]
MQIRCFPAVFFLMILFCSCSEQKSPILQPAIKDSTEDHTFFPVTEYIRGQLNEIDSLPITPLKIINDNGKQDSIWMKKEDIRSFAQPFLHPEIDTVNFKSLFTEKSFLDQTINAFTFSYDPIDKLPDTLELRKWDVYIDPKKNTISRIYMVKEVKNNGTYQTLQLIWKSGQWCKITTITEQPGKQPDIKEELMKWDFNE